MVNKNNLQKLLVIAGSTASGKSDIAVILAQHLNAEVVNIDSVQVYKDFDIGSGKISQKDQQGITHHLLSFQDPKSPMNVAEFVEGANIKISEIISRGKLPILVAGTSLYVKCLIHGLAEVPEGDEELRAKISGLSTEDLLSQLSKVDPQSLETIKHTDRFRLIRALEVWQLSGKKISQIQKDHAYKESLHKGLFIFLNWPRERLYERINTRCKIMIQSGLLNETKTLIERYGIDALALKSLGYAQAVQAINEKWSEDKLYEEMSSKTRQFAKRQLTFWRNQPKVLGWKIRPSEEEGFLTPSITKVKSSINKIKDFAVFKIDLENLINEIKHNFTVSSNEIWNIDAEFLKNQKTSNL